jgi:hypothetical protein
MLQTPFCAENQKPRFALEVAPAIVRHFQSCFHTLRTANMIPSTFRQLVLARVRHEDVADHVPWRLHDKRKCYDFCADLEIATAQVYQSVSTVMEIDFDRLPYQFVLKPTTGHSSQGIMVLIRDPANNRYYNLLDRRHYTRQQIMRFQSDYFKKHSFKESYRLIAEELLIPENGQAQIPYDYKCYAFGGRVELIVQKNVNTRPYECHWFDGHWQSLPINTVIDWSKDPAGIAWAVQAGLAEKKNQDSPKKQSQASPGIPIPTEGKPVIPDCREDIVRTAGLVSRKVQSPFCRIDLYATSRGCVIGEVTFAPGGPWAGSAYFTDMWDQRLGQLWRRSVMTVGHT